MRDMDVFSTIADPTRRGILAMLERGPRAVGDIVARFPITAPAISQHIKALRRARLVRVRIDAQRRIYALDPRGFEQIERWLQRYRRFWNEKLDTLEAALREDLARSPAHKEKMRSRKSRKRAHD